MVDNPFTLTYEELLAMPLVEQYVTIACVSNEVGGDLVGNALWRGARLRDLLDRAGVQEGATQVVGRSFDGWTAGFPTAWLDVAEREALVAVAMNGDPLPPEHGYPARLIVPGLFGYVSATKWLTNIELTTLEAFNGYWVPLGWAKEAPILTQSRIDVPSSGASLGSRPAAGGGRRLGAGPRRQRGGGAGRRRGMGGRRAIDPDLGRHLGAVALPLGRAAGRPHPARARHRRHRRGTDRHRHRTRSRRSARLPHHHASGWVDAPRRIGSVPAPRAPLVIINPAAGMGRARELAPRIEEVLGHSAAKARLLETREPGHAERLAAAATDLGHDRVVAVGGDGTAQEVLNGLMAAGVGPDGGPPAFGLVPGGSGNDLARSLGLPLTPMEALTVALGEHTRPMDLGMASHDGEVRYFSAAGRNRLRCPGGVHHGGKRQRWQRGRAGYFLSTLNELRRLQESARSACGWPPTPGPARSTAGSCSWPSPTARTTVAACRSARTHRSATDCWTCAWSATSGGWARCGSCPGSIGPPTSTIRWSRSSRCASFGSKAMRRPASIWMASRSACCRSISAWQRAAVAVAAPIG